MRRYFISLLALSLSLAIVPDAPAQDAPGFEALSGVPVMEGLTEDLSQRVIFDKVEGRIIRTQLAGNLNRSDTVSFYREVLFQLGWIEATAEDGLAFTRDEEHLTLTFSDTSPLTVIISLRPLS